MAIYLPSIDRYKSSAFANKGAHLSYAYAQRLLSDASPVSG
jgi:hypothetical protein